MKKNELTKQMNAMTMEVSQLNRKIDDMAERLKDMEKMMKSRKVLRPFRNRIPDSLRKEICEYYHKSKKHTYVSTASLFNVGTTTVHRILAQQKLKKNASKESEVIPIIAAPKAMTPANVVTNINEMIMWIPGPALPWRKWVNDSINKLSLKQSKANIGENLRARMFNEVYCDLERKCKVSLLDEKLRLTKLKKKACNLDAVVSLDLCSAMTEVIKERALKTNTALCLLENDYKVNVA